jgi:hypothetical protein
MSLEIRTALTRTFSGGSRFGMMEWKLNEWKLAKDLTWDGSWVLGSHSTDLQGEYLSKNWYRRVKIDATKVLCFRDPLTAILQNDLNLPIRKRLVYVFYLFQWWSLPASDGTNKKTNKPFSNFSVVLQIAGTLYFTRSFNMRPSHVSDAKDPVYQEMN